MRTIPETGSSGQAAPRTVSKGAARPRPPGSALAFWAVMVFMAILLLAPQAIFPALAPFRIALLTAGAATVMHVFERLTSRRPASFVSREMKIAAGLLGWATLTIPFSYWRGGSVDTLTGLYVKSLILFWLIANTITTVGRFRVFAWGMTLMSVPIATTAVRNYLSGNVLQGSDRIAGYDAALTSNPNDLALTLNLIIPFILVFVRSSRGCFIRTLALGIAALNVAAVLLTFSRGGFITLMATLLSITWGLVRSRKVGWVVALLFLLLASLPLLPSSLWERWATITNVESDTTGSAQARRDQVTEAVRFIATHPVVGTGIGARGPRAQGAGFGKLESGPQRIPPVRCGARASGARSLSVADRDQHQVRFGGAAKSGNELRTRSGAARSGHAAESSRLCGCRVVPPGGVSLLLLLRGRSRRSRQQVGQGNALRSEIRETDKQSGDSGDSPPRRARNAASQPEKECVA